MVLTGLARHRTGTKGGLAAALWAEATAAAGSSGAIAQPAASLREVQNTVELRCAFTSSC